MKTFWLIAAAFSLIGLYGLLDGVAHNARAAGPCDPAIMTCI